MALARGQVLRKYEKELVIWVSPKDINYYVGKNTPLIGSTNKLLKKFNRMRLFTQGLIDFYTPFVIEERIYEEPKHVAGLQKYRYVKDLIENIPNYQSSQWYRRHAEEIRLRGRTEHKQLMIKSIDELNKFFEEYVLDLVFSMKENGYDINKGQQVGYVTIGSNGEIHKSNAGDHRFIVAKLLGTEAMPFRVKGVHEGWLKKQGLGSRLGDVPQIIKRIHELGKC